ncbi:MAG: J domain-containing protein [Alphaproteobacteria bacterium]|nr:J domain-containing protein [Alphaproteobacteria bacterium]
MASDPSRSRQRHDRFHGRVEGRHTPCAISGCKETGEFRALPEGSRGGTANRPEGWRWLCLDHVREFNQGYNYFSGMSAEEIHDAQRPYAGWESETRAFATNGASPPPRWQDFSDPIDAIGARFQEKMRESRARQDARPLSSDDRKALRALGLDVDADRTMLRRRYADLVRKYHPDRNGGDRSHEKALQDVISAYTHLRKAPVFA